MNAIITAAIALIQGLLPSLGTIASLANAGSTVANIISTLESVIPIVISTYKDLAPIIQSIIAELKNGDAPVTDDQMAQLDAMEATIDAAFDDAAANATAEDAAAD